MTGKNSKSKKSKSGAKKGGHEQAATHVTPQKENVPDSAPTEKSPQRTFQGDENGGLEQVKAIINKWKRGIWFLWRGSGRTRQ